MEITVLILLTIFTKVFGQDFDWDVVTDLDRYVSHDDGYYDYHLIEEYSEPGYTLLVLNMTSLRWMDETVTTEPVWHHHLAIAIPDVVTYPDALHIQVAGGGNDDEPPYPHSEERMTFIANFSQSAGAVAAFLKQVPNQPLFFTDTPNTPRVEDAIIARTWRYYIEEIVDDTDVIFPLPMVKAAKLAVDTIVEVVQDRTGNTIERYMPAGFSKRGWVSWLLGCVDPRVFAIAPIVFDIGNWNDNLHHHYEAYGGWSYAFSPYWNENVSMYIDHPRASEAFDSVAIDYMRYNSRLTMPKLISGGTCDEFFLPDDSHYFFDDLTEPKYILIFENESHNLGRPDTGRLDHVLESFFVAVLEGFQLPDISWERLEKSQTRILNSEIGSLIAYLTIQNHFISHGTHADLDMICNDEMLDITAWWADTLQRTCLNDTIDEEVGEELICRRDFRFETRDPPGENPIEFVETEVLDLGGGLFRVRMDYRDDEVEGPGYRGFFMTMRFPGYREGDELHFSTEIHVIPDTLPYPRCSTELECQGNLV